VRKCEELGEFNERKYPQTIRKACKGRSMNNFKLSTRLTVLIGFLSLVMIVIGVFGLYGISESNRRFKVVYEERLVALGDLLEVQRLLLRNRNAISTAIAIHTPEYTRQKHQEVQTNIEDVNRSWSAFRQTKLTQEEAQMADRFEAERARFLQGFLKPAQQALESADMELARQLLIDKDEALYAPLRDLIVELTSLQTRIAKEEYEAAQSLYQVVFAVAVGSIIAGVLLGVLLGWSIIRNMARSLRQAIHTADAVAAEVAHDGIAAPRRMAFDGVADVAQGGAGAYGADALPHGLIGRLDQAAGGTGDRADQIGLAGVGDEAVLLQGDVQVDDVAVLQHVVARGHAVADDMVGRDVQHEAVAVLSLAGGTRRQVVDDEGLDPVVDLQGVHARHRQAVQPGEDRGQQAAGFGHQFDLGRGLGHAAA
jgi:hypothetical protein